MWIFFFLLIVMLEKKSTTGHICNRESTGDFFSLLEVLDPSNFSKGWFGNTCGYSWYNTDPQTCLKWQMHKPPRAVCTSSSCYLSCNRSELVYKQHGHTNRGLKHKSWLDVIRCSISNEAFWLQDHVRAHCMQVKSTQPITTETAMEG